EEERRRQPLLDQRGGRLLERDRVAEVSLEQVLEEEQILLPERAVEAERVADHLRPGGGVVLAEDLERRVAGDQPQQEERDHGDPEQDRDQLQDAATDEA